MPARPLTSIFMAPPPPSRPTASGGGPLPNNPGQGNPAYNSALPGFPVTSLPEGGISILVPGMTAEPEVQPAWMPKARQGLGIGAVGKSSVWDVIGGAPPQQQSATTSSSPTSSRPGSRKPTLHIQSSGDRSSSEPPADEHVPRKRHPPRSPLDPHRLALISNALGVSVPLPPRSLTETKAQSRALADRGRQASLDDARLAQNHTRHTSLASFNSGPAHLRSSPSLSVTPRRQMTSSPAFATPSQPTRYLLHVYPPPHMPSIHPFASRSPPPGYHSQFRRGTLIPLHASLSGQLSAVAKEYGLPNTNGIFVYLLSADFEPPDIEDDDEYAAHIQAQRDDRSMGPRIGEEAWKMLWAGLLRADREELLRSYNPNEGGGSYTGSPASGVAALAGEDSPPAHQATISPKSSQSSFTPRPLRTVAAMNSREGFKSIASNSTTPTPTPGPLSVSTPSSLATHSRSNTSSPITTATTVSIMPVLPIVGKIEFDIDMRRAPWYPKFCAKAEQRRLPSRVHTPIGPLATPAPNGLVSAENRSPSPIVLALPPIRARSASPALGEEGRPVSPKFPIRLQLPSNPANLRGSADRGLLSPRDAMMTPTSPGGDWPSEDGPENETGGGLGLDLSPSSSTVAADGAVEGVVAEGYEALGEDVDTMSFSFHPPSDSEEQDFHSRGDASMLGANDPLGDVFPDEGFNVSTRAIMGIDDLPLTRNEDVDDETGELPPIGDEEEEEGVRKLWNEKGRPTLGQPAPFAKPSDLSAVLLPRPAPARQRSDSLKRPPPLKLGESAVEGDRLLVEEPIPRSSLGDETSIVVTGEDGEADWSWRSSEHVRKDRLDELEKALAQLSPRILNPPPPEFDRPRSPGLHHRMLSNGQRRPDPHAPLFMSEELSNLRASMAKGSSSPTGSTSSVQASPSWPGANSGSIPPSPRFRDTPRGPDMLGIPSATTPMSAEHRIKMQTEQMRFDMANLPPPGTAPPRPRRPQTPVTLNSPPMEDSPPVPGHQRSRFSIDSTGDDVASLSASVRDRSGSIMSVKGIKKLWRGRNSTQNLNGKAGEMTPPIPPSPNPQDSQLPQLGSAGPAHSRQPSQAQPAQVAAVKSSSTHKRDSSNSGKDPFHFDQEGRTQARSTSPSDAAREKEKATTKSILKKWSTKAKRADGEPESGTPSRPQSRQQSPLSPQKRALNGLAGGGGHSGRGSISSVNTLTNSNSLQADIPSRPSVSSSMVSDVEPMTPRMSQFEMVSPAPGQS